MIPEYIYDVHAVPTDIAVCPYCGGDLWCDFTEWDVETLMPTELGMTVWCGDDLAGIATCDHNDMPYVYWLPINTRVYQWMITSPEILSAIEKEHADRDRTKLAAWNRGEPIRAGIR